MVMQIENQEKLSKKEKADIQQAIDSNQLNPMHHSVVRLTSVMMATPQENLAKRIRAIMSKHDISFSSFIEPALLICFGWKPVFTKRKK